VKARLQKWASRGRRAWEAALERYVRPLRLRLAVRHVAGPRRVAYGEDELLLISVVRNGARHLDAFLDHHLALGVRHIVLLDNGSTDGTAERAAGRERVTVLRAACPYEKYENVMKRYLARRFSRWRWNLCADIDELFDWPCSDALPLRGLLAYLNHHGYTAALAQMLDLFSGEPLDAPEGDAASSPRERFRLYDLANVRRREYRHGTPGHPAIAEHRGGVRDAFFQSNNSLTKAALVRLERGVEVFVDWHHARNVRLADVSCLLLHYPFAGFAEKVADAVRTGRYGTMTTPQYENYWSVLQEHPGLTLRTPAAREYHGTAELVEQGFLVVSDAFRRWVAERHA
jgi:hypothetical protein